MIDGMRLLGTMYSKNAHSALEEGVMFKKRISAKAVIFDKDQKIAYLEIKEGNIFTIPGGGVEKNEDIIQGLRRECIEEAGVDIQHIKPIGYTIEYRAPQDRRTKKKNGREQHSYYFTAEIDGPKREPTFTSKEIERGFSLHRDTLANVIGYYEDEIHKQASKPFDALNVIPRRDLTVLQSIKTH